MQRLKRHTKRRSKLRTTARPPAFVVERLECRRLLSAAPYSIELVHSASRLDAFVQSHGQSQYRRDQHQSGQEGRKTGRDDNFVPNHVARRVTRSGDQGNNRDRYDVQNRNQIGTPQSTDGLASSLSLRARDAGTNHQTSFVTSSSVGNSLASNIVSPPVSLDSVLPQALSSAPWTIELATTRDSGPRPQLSGLGVRFVQSISSSTQGVNTEVALWGSDSGSSVTEAPADFAMVVWSTFDHAISSATDLFSSFWLTENDKRTSKRDTESASGIYEFGGAVDLDRIPRLVDTLPAVIDETTPLFELGEDEEHLGVSPGGDELGNSPMDLLNGPQDRIRPSDSVDEKKSTALTADRALAPSAYISTDVVFAYVDDAQLFGGEVEMPEPLAYMEDTDSAIPFDSIVPAAPRIDQIISQAPMFEVENNSEQTEEEPEPISINAQASVPAAILCMPAVAAYSAQRKQPQQLHEKNRKKWRAFRS